MVVSRGAARLGPVLGGLRVGWSEGIDPWGAMAGIGEMALGLAGVVALVRDAAADRFCPGGLLVALLLGALAPLPASGARPGLAELALLRCAARVARSPAGPHHCEGSAYRDRLLRPVPLQVVEIEGAEGPIRQAPPGVRPGTVLVAWEPERRWGWVTAVGLGEEGPALVRREGGLWVAGIVASGEGGDR